MKISVVIPTFGRPEMAAAAAASAAAQKLPQGVFREILVIDDGGKDGTAQALKKIRGLRYVWKPHAGPAAARNLGARLAKGTVIAFLDSDTLAQPGWLAAGLARLKRDATCFGVEGRVDPEAAFEATPFSEAVENPSGGRWLSCNLFVRRDEFLKLGGFDERFKRPVREDSEFAFRAMDAGKRFAFEPKARVSHPVRRVPASRYYFHAKEGIYEALIRRQHPRAYRRHFKWIDGRAIPAYYLAHYAAPFLVFFAPRLGALALATGMAAVLYAWCRRRRVSFPDFASLLLPALFAPYLRLYWVCVGEIRYPLSPE